MPELPAHAFANAINRQSVEELTGLMTEDHLFIDSLGAQVQGRDQMTAGWVAYFQMVPDYTITIEETYADGDAVVMLGTALRELMPQPGGRPRRRGKRACVEGSSPSGASMRTTSPFARSCAKTALTDLAASPSDRAAPRGTRARNSLPSKPPAAERPPPRRSMGRRAGCHRASRP